MIFVSLAESYMPNSDAVTCKLFTAFYTLSASLAATANRKAD